MANGKKTQAIKRQSRVQDSLACREIGVSVLDKWSGARDDSATTPLRVFTLLCRHASRSWKPAVAAALPSGSRERSSHSSGCYGTNFVVRL